MRLLRNWLSLEQRSEFDEFGYFHVIGCVTGKRYRIYSGSYANVLEIDEDGTPKAGLCFLPKGRLVPGDIMLAQKITLETSECVALAVAHRFPASLTPSHIAR
jgi:hypothetical protein